jgi:glutathione S-transferase
MTDTPATDAASSDELVFYTHPMSRGRMVRWLLEEIGQPYRTKVIDFGPPMKTETYLAINPMGKVPAIRHGGTVVTETGAICAYLADAFPAAGLAPPAGSRARGDYYRWLMFAAGPVEAVATNTAMGFELPPGKGGMAGYGSRDLVVETLKGLLQGRSSVAGDRFSAADLYLAAELGWMMQFGIFPKEPEFIAYVTPLATRPAAVRAREIDDALLAKHPHPFMKAPG